MDLTEETLYKSIFSPDEDLNPAFHDFAHSKHSFPSHFSYWYVCAVYVPYCSSDLYAGTRNASAQTNGRVFYGKHIVEAIIDSLIADNWIQQAEKVEKIIEFLVDIGQILQKGCFDRHVGWGVRSFPELWHDGRKNSGGKLCHLCKDDDC